MPVTTRAGSVPATPRVQSPSPDLSSVDLHTGPITRSARRRQVSNTERPAASPPASISRRPNSRSTSRTSTLSASPTPSSSTVPPPAIVPATPTPPIRRSKRSRVSREVEAVVEEATKTEETENTVLKKEDEDTIALHGSETTESKDQDVKVKNEQDREDDSNLLQTISSSSSSSSSPSSATPKTPLGLHLAPPTPLSTSANGTRSPSPLGLIPIHAQWRGFIHKHEVPRKALHVSIGFFVTWLYVSGTQPSAVTPWLMGAAIPITTVDIFRLHYPPFNALYANVLGAFMRESEFTSWNGVIFYLLGAWTVLYAFPKDVGIMGVLLLSWCDTAASTFGRLYGRYTPKLRQGKSLAGSTAAFATGVATAYFFWGWLAPRYGPFPGDEAFLFTGTLRLPVAVTEYVGDSFSLSPPQLSGPWALLVVSAWSGFVAAASEVVDLFGWDDNLTIPIVSGLGIWGFLRVFG